MNVCMCTCSSNKARRDLLPLSICPSYPGSTKEKIKKKKRPRALRKSSPASKLAKATPRKHQLVSTKLSPTSGPRGPSIPVQALLGSYTGFCRHQSARMLALPQMRAAYAAHRHTHAHTHSHTHAHTHTRAHTPHTHTHRCTM